MFTIENANTLDFLSPSHAVPRDSPLVRGGLEGCSANSPTNRNLDISNDIAKKETFF